MEARGLRTFAAYVAVGGTAILALAGLSLVTAKTQLPGLVKLRTLIVRPN